MEDILQYIGDLFRNAHLAIYAAAAVGLTSGFIPSLKRELRRSQKFPLAFSEYETIAEEHKEIGGITKYLTTANDICMHVFECHNNSFQGMNSKPHREFARNLESKLSQNDRSLRDMFSELPVQAETAKQALKDYCALYEKLEKVNAMLADAWEDTHYDHYRTQVYTTTDGKGHTTTHTRQVYDYTTHTYTYNREAGEQASVLLSALLESFPAISLGEKVLSASKVSNMSIEKMAESRKDGKQSVEITAETAVKIASEWKSGSVLLKNIAYADSEYGKIKELADAWQKAKETAHDASYNTHSRSDSGPEEFQAAESALETGIAINESIGTAFSSINESLKIAEELSGHISGCTKELYAVNSGKTRKQRRKTLEDAKELYTTNFNSGIDVDRFKESKVVLWSLIGAVGGGAIGLGIDALCGGFS